MVFKQIHKFFSFSRLLKFILGIAIFTQIVVITYNHFSGFYVLDDFQHFLIRLFRGTLYSMVGGFLIAYPDLMAILYLNKKFPWSKNLFIRIFLQFIATIVIAVIISLAVTLFANWISPYTEEFSVVLLYNALIYCVVNLLIMSVLEGWSYFIESRQAKQEAKNLQEELTQVKFEVLKSQINPHFMFNSLNVLSGLISSDVKKAQQFIDEFSQIYRYVLETIEQPVATLGKELDFMRSYLFLQQIRYGDTLMFSVRIPSELLTKVLPPLSLQVVLENAIKHNIINKAKPLQIDIYNEDIYLIVKNNIQSKISSGISTGLGQKNLVKRYALISKIEPVFYVETNHYIAKLPLTETEDDESSNR
ncbi:MAG: histidine kinase [Bacteroidales bacterium]|nr:histidine kinase [Bacteroidales bacterium]MCF8403455.1 histidine kinase [Bacteroidales bacterium]